MNYLIGIEREGFRVDLDGNMARTPHPQAFGDKLVNPLIGTDFGEPMLELRSYPHPDPESCYLELLQITRGALKALYEQGELLWPCSVPYQVPDEDTFPFNRYPGRPDLEEHERLITRVYGVRRLCLAGIHVNFSIGMGALMEIRRIYPNVPYDRDAAYLQCARQVILHEDALRHFFDASPTDFEGRLTQETSLRNSAKGMRNPNAKKLDYTSVEAYIRSLQQTRSYERLSAIRIKSRNMDSADEGIGQHGIERLEFRLCDVDPFDVCGISLHEIRLAVAVLFLCMTGDTIPDGPTDILLSCAEADRKLGLGFGETLAHYLELERNGCTKAGRVRRLICENGREGLMKLALRYGEDAAKGENRDG